MGKTVSLELPRFPFTGDGNFRDCPLHPRDPAFHSTDRSWKGYQFYKQITFSLVEQTEAAILHPQKADSIAEWAQVIVWYPKKYRHQCRDGIEASLCIKIFFKKC